jgi:hypothetical protein
VVFRKKKLLSVISSRYNDENHNISVVAVKWKKKLLSLPLDNNNRNVVVFIIVSTGNNR